jgi:hypothetical protein
MRRFRLAWQSVVVIGAISLAAASIRMRGDVTFDQGQMNSDVVGAVGLVLLVVGSVLTIWWLLQPRHTRRRQETSVKQIVAQVVAYALVMSAAYLFWREYHGFDLFRDEGKPDAAKQSPSTGGNDTSIASNDLWPVLLLVVAVATLVAILLLRRRRLVSRSDPEAETPAALVEQAARAGLSALANHDDARTAVIRCYESMAAVIRKRGVPSTAADTPTDLLTRATRNGVLHDPSGAELIELFQVARYASQPLPADAADRAAAALRRIIADAGRTAAPAHS